MERRAAQRVVFWPTTFVGQPIILGFQMSKRKPATASKHAHSPRIAAKAQRAAQAILRSPKASVPRSVGADLNEPPPKRHSQQDALPVENPHPETAFQDDSKQWRRMIQRKGLIFSPQPMQTCQLSYWKWHKPTCNLLLSSLRGSRRLGPPLNFPVSLPNSQASGWPCS